MNATPHWSTGNQVAFDTETTGIDVHTDRIVTAAVVHHKPGQRPRTLTWLIDPGRDIPTEASNVHGWTLDRIKAELDGFAAASYVGGRRTSRHTDPAQALFEIAGQVALAMTTATPLIAFNAAFDLSLLEAECARHDVPTLVERLAPKPLAGVVDPFVIDKHYSRRKGSRKLADQCSHYGVLMSAAGAHDASTDALAALRLVARQVAAYPELQKRQLAWLHQSQIAWRMEQQSSLAAYFNRVGKDHDGCCGEFPIHTACAPALTGGA